MPVTHAFQQQYKDGDFQQSGRPEEFEECTFTNCTLAEADLAGTKFIDCTFDQCDLSLANIKDSAWQDVRFTGSKLLGLRFDQCNAFLLALEFESCQLDFSSFAGLRFRHIRFAGCKMTEVDFTLADLKGVEFSDCDLSRAIFDRTLLESADFRTARNFTIDPEKNFLRGARFAVPEALRLLDKYDLRIDLS